MSTTETIAAIATPPGIGGIGIVRIAGPAVPAIADGVLGCLPRPREAKLAEFRARDGSPLDIGLALFFPAPGSFTGDPILELHGHGGPLILDRVLARVVELGARLARPGEFSQRAFLNGRLDLTQAEAIADLITSRTEAAARAALRTLQGDFSRRIERVAEDIIQLRVQIEASLDFADEPLGLDEDLVSPERLTEIRGQITQILSAATQGAVLREGLTVAIAGAPNVGKSSLMNALSGSDRAIVTPIPGTTRDLLHAEIDVEGLPIKLIDTAGLRATDDPIEKEGVRRAWREIEGADRVIWVSTGHAELDADSATAHERLAGIPITRVCNKIDLLGLAAFERETQHGHMIGLSALTGEGLGLLRRHLRNSVGLSSSTEGQFLARRRHLNALERAMAHLDNALAQATEGASLELTAEELRLAQRELGEITGAVTPEDLLDRIFSSFCIGK